MVAAVRTEPQWYALYGDAPTTQPQLQLAVREVNVFLMFSFSAARGNACGRGRGYTRPVLPACPAVHAARTGAAAAIVAAAAARLGAS